MYIWLFHYLIIYLICNCHLWSSSLVSCLGVLVLISLNAITNHLWNLHSWQQIKPWVFGVGALTPRITLRSIKQWELTQRKPLDYKTRNHLNHQSHPVNDASSKQQTKQNYKPNHQNMWLPPHSALPVRGETTKLSTNLTLCKAHTNHCTDLRGAETKRKDEFNLEAWEKETSNTIC